MNAFNSIGHDFSGVSILIFGVFIVFAVYAIFFRDNS